MMDTLTSRFPEEWRGLFSALDHGAESEHYAELWLTETQRSQYGDAASWSSFIQSLCNDEPCPIDSKLCYCPRLLVFPINLQRNILRFIYRYKEKFLPDDLMKLMHRVQLQQISDDWMCALLCLIDQHCKSCQHSSNTTEDKAHDVKPADPIYTFSSRTQSCLKDFYATLQSLHPSSDKHFEIIKSDTKVKTECNETEFMDVDVDESFADPKHFSQSQYRHRHISFNRSQIRSNFESSFLSQRNRFLEDNMQSMFDSLKELWHRQQKASEEDLQLFSVCNQDQVGEVCCNLELSGACEGVISVACDQFTCISQQISYSTAVCFANTCILPSVLNLEESPTRTLLSTLLGYARVFPKQSVDGIFVPCSLVAGINSSHTDLLSKVLKESFAEDHKKYYLETYLHQCSLLSEAMVPVLQQLLDAKVRLNEAGVAALIGILESNSLSLSGNLKFGKLLLAVITKYSKQLTPNYVNSLRQAVESNKTFLKRSCLAALKKLKM